MFYLLVTVSCAYLLPVSLQSLCVSVLSTKKIKKNQKKIVQCYRVLSDFHPMTNDYYVTCLGEFSIILFYLHKFTSLGEIAQNCSYLPYINLNLLN